eukprot:m.190321 g.190321  ORF g.190321 m.190321 type:complete len:335 (+) comp15639_c0_seq1:187-1191(+)
MAKDDIFKASLTHKYNEGVLEVQSRLPPGIEIREGSYGKQLVATRTFSKGSVMYHANGIELDFDDKPFVLRVIREGHDDEIFEGLDTTHSVMVPGKPNRRTYYGFDVFTNHSCDASIRTLTTETVDNILHYAVTAIRDIAIGDTITENYATFDYECNGHEIEKCECGAEECMGQMKGFKNLPWDMKLKLMPYTDEEVLKEFYKNEKPIMMTSALSLDTVQLSRESSGKYFLVAAKEFKKDDVVYVDKSISVPKLNDSKESKFVLKVSSDQFILLDGSQVKDENSHWVSDGLHTFTNIKSDGDQANINREAHENDGSYTVRAIQDIKEGEMLISQ